MAWICSVNKKHVFQDPTPDYFCDKCEPHTGILIEENIDDPIPVKPGEASGGTVPKDEVGNNRYIGLCILLMDASGSMEMEKPFKGNPLSRMRLVATSAAAGIFDLKGTSDVDNAYILALKFDHKVERMFLDTVGGLMRKYNDDVDAFADAIYKDLFEMQGQTNINDALKAAHNFVNQFINKKMPHFQDYTPMEHNTFKEDMSTLTIPNVRVLLYTDGIHWTGPGSQLKENPFKKTSDKIPADILIGAFFGDSDHRGVNQIRQLVSECPKHGEEQFFLFDTPEKYPTLRNLFKMASGASGFCPVCIKEHENSFIDKA